MHHTATQFRLLPPNVEPSTAHKAGIALGALVRSYRSNVRRMREDVDTFVNEPYHLHPAKPLVRGGFLLGYLGMEKPTTDLSGRALVRLH